MSKQPKLEMKTKATGDMVAGRSTGRALVVPRVQRMLHLLPPGCDSWSEALFKAVVADETEKRSKQGATMGLKSHPFDMRTAAKLMESNPHHAAAIMAKRNATTGLGYVTNGDKSTRTNRKMLQGGGVPKPPTEAEVSNQRSKASEVLDPLCAISMQDLMNQVGEDLANTHNGYIEVVRKNGTDASAGTITGLHYLPARETFIHIENEFHDFHFEVNGPGVFARKFARFGDKAQMMKRLGLAEQEAERVSEVIHFRYPSSLNRYYGIPVWLSAVAAIELVQALHQHEFDFYNNRGVPEFLLFLLGKQLNTDDWNQVKAMFASQVGLGNTRKSGAFNFEGDMKVQVEKLAMEGKSDGRFTEMSNALALEIVAGHRIPPLLAGITIAGKLGAANELPNALMAYQVLCVGPDQLTIQSTMGATLGNEALNGGLGLTFDDFESRTILDVMDLQQMDTVARMRQSVPEAQAEGRDTSEGLKKSATFATRLLKTTDPEKLMGDFLAEMAVALHERAA